MKVAPTADTSITMVGKVFRAEAMMFAKPCTNELAKSGCGSSTSGQSIL